MKNSYTTLLLLTLSIGLYFMYVSPTLSEIKGLSAKKAEYDDVLLKASELSSKRDAILAEYNSIPEEDIEKLNKIITDEYVSESFANDINNLALNHGLAVKSIRDNPSINTEIELDGAAQIPFKKHSVRVDMSGSYESFVSFLSDVETSLRLMDVNTLSIVATKSGENSISGYEFKLEIIVYSLK